MLQHKGDHGKPCPTDSEHQWKGCIRFWPVLIHWSLQLCHLYSTVISALICSSLNNACYHGCPCLRHWIMHTQNWPSCLRYRTTHTHTHRIDFHVNISKFPLLCSHTSVQYAILCLILLPNISFQWQLHFPVKHQFLQNGWLLHI